MTEVTVNHIGLNIDKWMAMMEWLDLHDPDNTVLHTDWSFHFPDSNMALLFKLTFGGR